MSPRPHLFGFGHKNLGKHKSRRRTQHRWGGGHGSVNGPEVLNPDRYSKQPRQKLPSKSTEMYSLGMTVLEVRISSQPLLFLPSNLFLQFLDRGGGAGSGKHTRSVNELN